MRSFARERGSTLQHLMRKKNEDTEEIQGRKKVSTRMPYHQNIDRIECGRHVSSRFLVSKSFRISDGDEGHRVAAVSCRFILFPSQVSSKRSSSPQLRNSYAREKVDSRVDSESSRTSLYVSNVRLFLSQILFRILL